MWKRLQRVGKEASKFQFTVSYQELIIDCQNNWYPKMICIAWSRRKRQEKSEMHPLVADPDVAQRFLTSWNVPENFISVVTLFRSSGHSRFEPKDWVFTLYEGDVPLATQTLNLSDYAGHSPSQVRVDLPFKSKHRNVRAASLHFTISCAFIKQGKATDDDLQSISSLMSMDEDKGERQRFGRNQPARWTVSGDRGRPSGPSGKKRRSFRLSSFSRGRRSSCDADSRVARNLARRYNLAQYLEDHELSPGIEEDAKEDEKASTAVACDVERVSGDPTPTEALMDWCLEVTKGYPSVKIKDMTTSWRNGLAFCAILHHYKPDLIDFDSLDPSDICGNCKLAFEVGEKLGIPRVIEPSDMVLLLVPDKLSVMTYLFQLRSFFTDSYCDVDEMFYRGRAEQSGRAAPRIPEDRSPSPYSVASTKVSSLERNHNKKIDRSPAVVHQFPSCSIQKDSATEVMGGRRDSEASSPLPGHENPNPPQSPGHSRESSGLLMTRKQLFNPFDSDEDECTEPDKNQTSSTARTDEEIPHTSSTVPDEKKNIDESDQKPPMQAESNPVPPPRLSKTRSRQEELKEEARLKILMARRNQPGRPDAPPTPISEKDLERQRVLHERARQLIEETKSSKIVTEIIGASKNAHDSPRSLGGSMGRRAPEPSCYFNSAEDEEDVEGLVEDSSRPEGSKPPRPPHPPPSFLMTDAEGATRSPYVSSEMDDLEREQLDVDEKAAQLEWELRRIMRQGSSKELEEEKLKEWFGLVNRKNALIRRQMQLNLLEKERDLEKRFNLLSIELRKVMSEPDWMKTDDVRRRETMLLAELIELVDKRDELVQSLDSQERAIEDDEKMEMMVDQSLSLQKKKKKKRRKLRRSIAGNSPSHEGTSPTSGHGSPTACTVQ